MAASIGRPSLDLIYILVQQHLGQHVNFTFVSSAYLADSRNWWVRLAEKGEDGKQYYRMAEGTGKKVRYVSPLMLANTSTVPRKQGQNDVNRSDNREMVRVARNLVARCNTQQRTLLEQDRLGWLFEERQH